MELLDKYFELQKQIYDYFGYKEDWRVIPLEDSTQSYWFLEQEEDGPGKVYFSDKPFTLAKIADGDFYSNEIYTQRFLPKWVYEGPEYTMVCVDTHTDGNKFLQIFDNNKQIHPSSKMLEALEHWRMF